MIKPQKQFMEAAIEEAIKARSNGDYAIGAVIVKNNEIIVRAINLTKVDQDPTQHAEIVAIRKASRIMGSRYLKDCVLYTTHEPCPMCTSAAVWAKIQGIVSGARIRDIMDYQLANGNNDWKWRVINISAKEVISSQSDTIELIEDFMRSECIKLFHSS